VVIDVVVRQKTGLVALILALQVFEFVEIVYPGRTRAGLRQGRN